MAKKKGSTEIVALQCENCKQRNYTIIKNKKNNPDRMTRSKYCRFERKHTPHKESKN
ncbi:MAG: 50S ribosomal protein L33 [Candidatus Omnitrophota bacterium]